MNKAVKCLVVVGCAVMLCGCGNSENRIEQQQSLRTQGIAQAQSGDYDSAVQSFDQALKLSDMQVGRYLQCDSGCEEICRDLSDPWTALSGR